MDKKNILIIGGGGREAAIAYSLSQSARVGKIYAAPGNAGIAKIGECVPISATDVRGIVDFVKSKPDIYMTVIGPDNSLAAGLADALAKEGRRVFGPTAAAAEIESSKVFSKDFMKRNNIPTAAYEAFSCANEAMLYLKTAKYPLVVKADGLALGKGVLICEDRAAAENAVKSIMEDRSFGSAGERIIIEEFVKGWELTILVFTDGKTVKPMVTSRDYKRAYDGNKGPNTGGMGCYSPVVEFAPLLDRAQREIFEPTVSALAKEGRTFKGVLYFDLMVDGDRFNVIEYNARFGDPETQVVLPRLKTDLLDVLDAVIDGTLDKISLDWDKRPRVCVVAASEGYPGDCVKGREITVGGTEADTLIFHAGTALRDGKTVTSGGRVLSVVCAGATVKDARERTYNELKKVAFQGMFFRTDIAKEAQEVEESV